MPTPAWPADQGTLLGDPGGFYFVSSSLPKSWQALAPSCPGHMPRLPGCAPGSSWGSGAVEPDRALGPEALALKEGSRERGLRVGWVFWRSGQRLGGGWQAYGLGPLGFAKKAGAAAT